MDRPDADHIKLRRTIRQFEMINRLFSSIRRQIKKYIFSKIKSDPSRKYRFLDIGTGGGDIPRWIARYARRKGWKITITAVDVDSRIVPWARASVKQYPEISVEEGSAFNLQKWGEFDFIISNNVFHHFPMKNIIQVLRKIDSQAREVLLVNDLKRSRWAYIGFTIYAALFTVNSLAFHDGRLSIRRGFTREELEDVVSTHFANSGISVFTGVPARIGFIKIA
jgi:2-polyprenyl-3-methyl-5-hydroxy-6-metoxy-1,4-benzoquinol methylase